MQLVQRLGLIVLAACALSVAAVSNASASLFLAHPPGGLLGKALNTQFFLTAGGTVECKALKLLNTVALTLRALTQHATVDYENCKAFGLAATVSPVLYLFHADDGAVDLLGTVKISALKCEVIVSPANGLKTVKFRNLNGAISIEGTVAGITSEGKEVACTYAKENKGTYTGVADVSLHTGTLLWEQL